MTKTPFPSLHFTSLPVVRSIAEGDDKNVRPLLCGVRLAAFLLRTPRETYLYGYLVARLGLLRV